MVLASLGPRPFPNAHARNEIRWWRKSEGKGLANPVSQARQLECERGCLKRNYQARGEHVYNLTAPTVARARPTRFARPFPSLFLHPLISFRACALGKGRFLHHHIEKHMNHFCYFQQYLCEYYIPGSPFHF